MVQHNSWFLFIEILILAFDAFNGNETSTAFPLSSAFPSSSVFPPPSAVSFIPIDTSTLRLLWSSPINMSQALLGYNITWDFNVTFVDYSSTAFVITNLPTPGEYYAVGISAYYDTQQNSEYITVYSSTYPSPASGITVASREMNRMALTWTNAGWSDNCFVWVDTEASASTSCFAGNKTAVITGLSTAGKAYTIYIMLQGAMLNSTIVNVTERTIPSPASSITVFLRQTNGFVLNWTNEGVADSCSVWVQNATFATTSCFTGNKTAVIADLPTPGKRYTIYLTTYSGQQASAYSTITESAGPFELVLTALPLPNSTVIMWTLSAVIGGIEPETYCNLTITDTRDPTFIIRRNIAGFYNRSIMIGGLDEYWNYTVAIGVHIVDENKEALATNGANVIYFQTLQSTPGAVQSFNVSSLSIYQQCNSSLVTWEAPDERDLNGIITNYVIRWQQINGADRSSIEVSGDKRQTTVRVQPDDQKYNFTIQAKTQDGEGVASTAILPSTGSCLPAPPVQNVSSILVTSVSDDNNNNYFPSTPNSFVVTFDLSFFLDNDNGNITNSGLFVREVPDQENITGAPEFGNQSLYSNALTWSEAIKQRRIPEYLATGENWLADAKNVTRKKRAFLQQFMVGGDLTCSKSSNVNCNGPLPPDRVYQASALSCTRSGCYKTEYSNGVKTKKSSSKGWIAAAVLVPIICIVAVVLIVIYFKPIRNYVRGTSSKA